MYRFFSVVTQRKGFLSIQILGSPALLSKTSLDLAVLYGVWTAATLLLEFFLSVGYSRVQCEYRFKMLNCLQPVPYTESRLLRL